MAETLRKVASLAPGYGTPFISFFTPHVSAAALADRYFAGGTDGLRPPNNSEELPGCEIPRSSIERVGVRRAHVVTGT